MLIWFQVTFSREHEYYAHEYAHFEEIYKIKVLKDCWRLLD